VGVDVTVVVLDGPVDTDVTGVAGGVTGCESHVGAGGT
jgi:hypothetical protein